MKIPKLILDYSIPREEILKYRRADLIEVNVKKLLKSLNSRDVKIFIKKRREPITGKVIIVQKKYLLLIEKKKSKKGGDFFYKRRVVKYNTIENIREA